MRHNIYAGPNKLHCPWCGRTKYRYDMVPTKYCGHHICRICYRLVTAPMVKSLPPNHEKLMEEYKTSVRRKFEGVRNGA